MLMEYEHFGLKSPNLQSLEFSEKHLRQGLPLSLPLFKNNDPRMKKAKTNKEAPSAKPAIKRKLKPLPAHKLIGLLKSSRPLKFEREPEREF
jgi:hypothetical protein